MKFNLLKALLFTSIIFVTFPLQAQDADNSVPISKRNKVCLKCHGQVYFSYFNEYLARDVKERMNPYYFVDSSKFMISNHRTFDCTDCHSSEYNTFPHPNQLRFEPLAVCMDCHGGDENFAKFNFEGIDEEYQASIHFQKHNEEFNCWMCHNPHSYHISIRNTENLAATIQYDNEICLNCHMDQSRLGLLSDREIYNMLNKHEWLPNHLAHFKSVRCIECHAEANANTLVAHKILPKDKAVKKCVECHSQNSILLASLYKYQVQEKREKQGYFNAAILTETYVIGANRNKFLNMASLGIFGLVVIGIMIHAVLRKIHSKN
jgi:hypothetical protein